MEVLVFKQEIHGHMLDKVIAAGREWLCGVPHHTEDRLIIEFIHAEYPGGWCAFVRDQDPDNEATLRLLMIREFGLDLVNRLVWRS